MAEDLAYAKLTSEALSYLPDELKNRLTMLSLSRSARRYKGPSRKMNLLDNNAVPVIHLSTENARLRSEKEKLELINELQKIGLEKRDETIRNYEEQDKSLYNLLAQALVWAVAHKNSAEHWRDQFIQASKELMRQRGLPEEPPLSDSRTGVSSIPVEIKGTGITPFYFTFSWRELYGKEVVVWQRTQEGPEHIVAAWKINPERAEALVERVIT